MIKSLKAQAHTLSETDAQLDLLNGPLFYDSGNSSFTAHLKENNQFPLKPTNLEIFQINLGYMCNQTCAHCHVDAGPDRKEIMTRDNMQICVDLVRKHNFKTIDLTGGAPEMNPDFRWFVTELKKAGAQEIIVRCNLTIIVANKKYNDLPEFFKEHDVRVVSSLPYYKSEKTDKQRGNGVFDKSIKALKMLNAVGYGKPGTGLILDLVYNPAGAFLPGNQMELESDFKKELSKSWDIEFNSLLAITNLPISRFLDYLVKSENFVDYMVKLVNAFNPSAIDGLMCRNTISIDWDGHMFDCDFNQMLDIKIPAANGSHISTFDIDKLSKREISVNQHCFGCTAGAGSSCQGTTA
ncbi:arsenosugar biosynthesis radical SAM (seleno)protein ArsS [Crocinitomix catalasitica]|uniref:arsenosugar biosynthesis radical SAM (seleno)protein ArsS n=1 Tax=Crocinitomix catalasitica TaxID=184607 RepID=UPI0004809C89|nr:arsenosugar biosynthesis radical SAM (seleno)protein ArsS [Crocinitomix catalasitica]